MSRENSARQDLERTRRRLENELKENLEQLVDKNANFDDLKLRLEATEAELIKLQTRLDEEMVAKAIIMKQVSNMYAVGTMTLLILILFVASRLRGPHPRSSRGLGQRTYRSRQS